MSIEEYQNKILTEYGESIQFNDFFKKQLSELNQLQFHPNQNNGAVDVIDFFSGCGGMSLGFSALSQKYNFFNIKGGIDINEIALKSYADNFDTKTLKQDIRVLFEDGGKEIIESEFELKENKPLIIIGCAPCQGFTAHRKKNWHKDDERNTLIGAFADLAVKFNPQVIVMENVPEILGKKYWSHYAEARKVFEGHGYKVQQTIYNSASFGVSQSRSRAIIIAYKNHSNLPLPYLRKDQYRTVRDAIGDLPPVEAGQIIDNGDRYHRSAKHQKRTIETIKQVPKNGGNRPKGVGPNCLDKVNGFYDVYGRLHWDKPSITLTQYSRNPASGRFTHPEQDRGLTIREAARLQSFPDDFKFHGSLDQCFSQIGESVPPALSLAIASQIFLDMIGFGDQSRHKVKSIENPVSGSYNCEIQELEHAY